MNSFSRSITETFEDNTLRNPGNQPPINNSDTEGSVGTTLTLVEVNTQTDWQGSYKHTQTSVMFSCIYSTHKLVWLIFSLLK